MFSRYALLAPLLLAVATHPATSAAEDGDARSIFREGVELYEGGKFIAERQSYIGGKTPVNVDGGLKAKGHPIGTTGVSMTVEIAKQLRGEAGERQVPNADVGLTHNVGGIGQYTFVQVMRRN